jgi:hypothetical protein
MQQAEIRQQQRTGQVKKALDNLSHIVETGDLKEVATEA